VPEVEPVNDRFNEGRQKDEDEHDEKFSTMLYTAIKRYPNQILKIG
jgi:hypothetical protein